MPTNISIDDMAAFCKAKGFVYPSAEIYGGLAGFYDFGHLGVELKNNIKREWWRYHVSQREDIVGIDGSIITNPNVWVASGHAAKFEDIMLACSKCGHRVRADTFLEEALGMQADGLKADEMGALVRKNSLKCPKCKSGLDSPREFNLMLTTSVGHKDDSRAYLRPETAQLIFTNFRLVTENARMKLPFGIAQAGKAFRNEISPRDFLFRCREFEQMEIEYFVHPERIGECPYMGEVSEHEIVVYSAGMQEKKQQPRKMKMSDALANGIIKTPWHAYWLATEHKWFASLGAIGDNFRIRQHLDTEKSHYALDTWDLEYKFPFGWKELQGMANRTDFDLNQHIKHSKSDLSYFDEDTKKKVVPHVVAEPSQGVEMAFMVFMFDSYNYDKERGNVVLKLSPRLAPIKVGVFPLVNKLRDKAREVYNSLRNEFECIFDSSGSIGRRYAGSDEIGIPACVTIDFDSLEKSDCTIRDRDTTRQARVKLSEIKDILRRFLSGESIDKLGKQVN